MPDKPPLGLPIESADPSTNLRSLSWTAEFSNSELEKFQNLDLEIEGDGTIIEYLNNGKKERSSFPSVLEWGRVLELKENLFADFISGLTVASVICTESLAIAIMAGLHPHYGLYPSAIPLCLYALLGKSKHVATGPVSVVAIVLGSILSDVPQSEKPQAAIYISLVVGIFLTTLGSFKMGYVEYILSTPALKGFIAGVVFKIILQQVQHVFGVKFKENTTFGVINELFSRSSEWHIASMVVGLIVILFLGGLLMIKKLKNSNHIIFFLGPLMTGVFGTLAIGFSGLHEKYNIEIVRDIENNIPNGLELTNPFSNFFSYTGKYLFPGLVLGLIGFVETIAISKEVATQKGYTIDANKEFLSYGIVNIFSSFLGCMPVFGSLSRTPISVMSGTRSQLSGFITGLVVTIVCFVGIPLINLIPLCVVGATIIFSVARSIRLLKLVFLLRYYTFPDGCMMALAMLTTALLNPEIGAGITVFCSLLVILKRGTTPWLDFQNYQREPNTFVEEPLAHTEQLANNRCINSSSILRNSNIMLNSPRLTNPNTKYKFFTRVNAPVQLDNIFKALKSKDLRLYQDFCLCLDVDCPEKYHIIILSLAKDFYYLNSHSLKMNLEPLKNLAPTSSKPEGLYIGSKAKFNKSTKTVNAIVIDCHKVKTIDFTACIALLETIEEFEQVGITVALSELDAEFLKSMRATGLRNNIAAYSNRDTIEIVEKLMNKVVSKERKEAMKKKLNGSKLDQSRNISTADKDSAFDGVSLLMQKSEIVSDPETKDRPIQKNTVLDEM